MSRRRVHTTLPVLLAALLPLASCADGGSEPVAAAAAAAGASATNDELPATTAAALEPWQERLLALSFDAADDFPLDPHHKNRGRAEEKVVQACIALGALDRAVAFNREVSNWRKGAGYADIAYALVEGGSDDEDRVLGYLDEARRIAPTGAEWRKDRVLAKVGKCYARMGRPQMVYDVTQGIAPI